jgi:hypothetical protein
MKSWQTPMTAKGMGLLNADFLSKESERHRAISIPNRCLQWVQRIGELEKEVVRWKSMYEVTEQQLKNISEKYFALVQNGYVPLLKGIYRVLQTLLSSSL